MDELEDKAKRVRSLLASYYSTDASGDGRKDADGGLYGQADIDSKGFEAERFVQDLLARTKLEGLLSKHVEMAAEIKNLDSDMQMLVYENYNKFISATDTIKRMKDNVAGMEIKMGELLETITTVRGKSDGVNSNLSSRRERIEQLNGTRSLLRKVQFVFDLPKRLRSALKHEAYSQAVKYYVGALPILKKYGDSSFQQCKEEAEEVMETITAKLQARVMSDKVPDFDRAEATSLLEQLNQPVDKLQDEFLARHWERLLIELRAAASKSAEEISSAIRKGPKVESNGDAGTPRTVLSNANKEFIEDFASTAKTFRQVFPSGESKLISKAKELFEEYFGSIRQAFQPEGREPTAEDLLTAVKILSVDVIKLHELVPAAELPQTAQEAVEASVRQHVSQAFQALENKVQTAIASASTSTSPASDSDEKKPLAAALESATDALSSGGVELLNDLGVLLDGGVELLASWRDSYTAEVQVKLQNFFDALNSHFLSVAAGAEAVSDKASASGASQAVPAGVVLMLARLAARVESKALPKLAEIVAANFGGGSRGSSSLSWGDIGRLYKTTSEQLLQQYIDTQARRLTLMLKKSVATPNWLKVKEPRDVRMVADLLLQEVAAMQEDAEQLLEASEKAVHRRSGSATSVTSDRGSDRRLPQKGSKSRLLERDVAKLFQEKVDLFTKAEMTQPSVVTAVLKICLKGFQECVRLETFSRSGFQQIQLDTYFLRSPLKVYVDDESVIDTLLDEVCSAAAERSLDPVQLEPSIIEKIISSKRTRSSS